MPAFIPAYMPICRYLPTPVDAALPYCRAIPSRAFFFLRGDSFAILSAAMFRFHIFSAISLLLHKRRDAIRAADFLRRFFMRTLYFWQMMLLLYCSFPYARLRCQPACALMHTACAGATSPPPPAAC